MMEYINSQMLVVSFLGKGIEHIQQQPWVVRCAKPDWARQIDSSHSPHRKTGSASWRDDPRSAYTQQHPLLQWQAAVQRQKSLGKRACESRIHNLPESQSRYRSCRQIDGDVRAMSRAVDHGTREAAREMCSRSGERRLWVGKQRMAR